MRRSVPGLGILVLAVLGPCAAAWAAGEPEFHLRIENQKFVPAELHIPAGVKVRVVIDNRDEVADEFDSHALNREKHVPAKGEATIFLGPLDPGRYPFEGEMRGKPPVMARGMVVVP